MQHIFVARWEIDAIVHLGSQDAFVAGCPFLGLGAMGYIGSIEDMIKAVFY